MQDNMRELVKKQIVRSFEKGLDELNITFINYDRERDHKPLVTPLHLEGDKGWYDQINPDFDIQKFVDSLTDEELLSVLDSQACLAYR